MAKTSLMPVEVLETALSIAVHLTKEKLIDITQTGESCMRGRVHEMGRKLVQVARNSLLDLDALRQVYWSECRSAIECENSSYKVCSSSMSL